MMTDDEIKAFRAELMADPHARVTDAPHACTRALAAARGARQKAAKAKARATVVAAHSTWIASGREGAEAIALTLAKGRS
jgi:hypothetical protein